MDTGFFQVILIGNLPNGQDISKMGDERCDRRGNDMPDEQPPRAGAACPRGLNILLLADNEDFTADYPGVNPPS